MSPVLFLVTAADGEAEREDIRAGNSPRRDYLEIADQLSANIIDNTAVNASPSARRLNRILRRGTGHAWLGFQTRHQHDVIFSDGEHIGLPLGFLLSFSRRRPRHVVIGHSLSAHKKRAPALLGRRGIDSLIVHSSTQLDFAIRVLGFDASQVYLLPYQVDSAFWQSSATPTDRMVLSCGLEKRDYPTLLKAIDGQAVHLYIGAMSRWSHSRNSLAGQSLPSNVTVGSYSYSQLREMYALSQLVVVPLEDVDYHAGITTVLEAMSMGRPVIVSWARGQRDTIVGPVWASGQADWPSDGPAADVSNGIYVRPGDHEAMRSAINYLLERPQLMALLGANGRNYVRTHASLEHFKQRVLEVLDPLYAIDRVPAEHR